MSSSIITNSKSEQSSARERSSCYDSPAFSARTIDAVSNDVKTQIALENTEGTRIYGLKTANPTDANRYGATSMDGCNMERKYVVRACREIDT